MQNFPINIVSFCQGEDAQGAFSLGECLHISLGFSLAPKAV